MPLYLDIAWASGDAEAIRVADLRFSSEVRKAAETLNVGQHLVRRWLDEGKLHSLSLRT